MFFSRKQIFKEYNPLYTASRTVSRTVYNVSSKCWIHGSKRTSALLRTVARHKQSTLNRVVRHYSSNAHNPGTNGDGRTSGTPPNSSLYRRVVDAWKQTPVEWYPIPIAVGAILLVVIQYRRKSRQASKEVQLDENGHEVIKLRGPWHVHVLGALPLRNASRLWGYMNSVELPIWFRPYGFRFYAYLFGCNLNEIEPADLTAYTSLGDFFYRKLKDGVRPVDNAVLVSPADGKILHFGTIQNFRVEQVKGMTYSLDALLGIERPDTPPPLPAEMQHFDIPVVDHKEFANVNGIEYSLQQLLGSRSAPGTATPGAPSSSPPSSPGGIPPPPHKIGEEIDASVSEPTLEDTLSVASSIGIRPTLSRTSTSSTIPTSLRPNHSLFFTVIYLAPGDYHRFHSPTAWVVEKRRHFVGELFSVSPWMAKRLENLFVLNERVVLLGRWRHGFFGMVPVGATNVGSIKVNFDTALRTNERRMKSKSQTPIGTYTEAVYSAASPLLHGQPLLPAQEMGGFCLGSTIVLVFEAPDDFEFSVKAGQKVKVGMKLGDVVGAEAGTGKDDGATSRVTDGKVKVE